MFEKSLSDNVNAIKTNERTNQTFFLAKIATRQFFVWYTGFEVLGFLGSAMGIAIVNRKNRCDFGALRSSLLCSSWNIFSYFRLQRLGWLSCRNLSGILLCKGPGTRFSFQLRIFLGVFPTALRNQIQLPNVGFVVLQRNRVKLFCF